MATNVQRFVFDRMPDADVLEKRLGRELSLRWKFVIIRELKDLYQAGRLDVNGHTCCQERLAKTLGQRWYFCHIAKTHEILQAIAAGEIEELQRLIEDRYEWFLHCEQTALDKIKVAEASIIKLEVGMTRQHNAVSKQYQIWLKSIDNNPAEMYLPFERTPDVDTNSGWHAWFRLEEQLLKAELELERQNRAKSWVFCDMLAAITNGLIEKNEM
ncbi:hypothetical protein N0V84_002840 [Fusarium piperis]|uniref:Uncharacterized protein n=1 Tax=Fusarium piperis TaxID=1435070 RepID=A0A9W8WIT2_9HYPO|nr:hypothetical protein N0V84_002840 [Fusarium piperis]